MRKIKFMVMNSQYSSTNKTIKTYINALTIN